MAFAIDEAEVVNGVEVQVAGTYNEYVGTVASGTGITNVAWVLGSGDRNYASGALTRVYIPVSAERENRIVEWGLVHADQDGTLKAGAVDNAAVLAIDVVETAKIKDGAVSTAKLADASVTIPKISNPYKFRVSRNAAANTGSGAFATIAFDTEQYDTNNNFAAGVYTIPVTGYYHFDWNVNATLAGGADELIIASVFHDNTEVSTGARSTGIDGRGSGGSDLLYCVAGKVVDVRVFCTVARALIVGGTKETRFSGYLVSVA